MFFILFFVAITDYVRLGKLQKERFIWLMMSGEVLCVSVDSMESHQVSWLESLLEQNFLPKVSNIHSHSLNASLQALNLNMSLGGNMKPILTILLLKPDAKQENGKENK